MNRDQAVVYCAGFFDGEGCVSLEEVRQSEEWCRKHRQNRDTYREYRMRCRTTQKFHDEPLRIMAATFGGTVAFDGVRFTHMINGRFAVAMLTEMLPFLTVKLDQAEIAVRWFDMDRAERRAALVEVRKLKSAYKFLGA